MRDTTSSKSNYLFYMFIGVNLQGQMGHTIKVNTFTLFCNQIDDKSNCPII